MFIRQTKTRNKASGEAYTTYRLVRSERVGGKVRQITLLNLGRNFSVPQSDWPMLCQRVEELVIGQSEMFSQAIPKKIEKHAQHYAAQLMARSPVRKLARDTESSPQQDFQEVDIESLESLHPRTVGVEHVGLHAMEQLGFLSKLEELGIQGTLRDAIVGSIIGRMASPGSELHTHRWLQNQSGLGELIDVDFKNMPLMRLYRASDALMRHKDAIENYLFSRVYELFGLGQTITLYDLTNTYFEGEVCSNPKAKRGRSKERRNDCPLVTLGLVLDGSGFVRRSMTFEGNASECKTLQEMLVGLGAKPNALVVMDCGIATEKNIAWLVENKFRYLVVSRKGVRQFDESNAVNIKNGTGEVISIQKEISEDGKEAFLHCHSAGREKKELAQIELFSSRYEAGLQKIADGLQNPKGEKRVNVLMERIGRLKARSHGISRHYQIELSSEGETATAITWEKRPVNGTMATHPGVYCLRTNELGWDEEKLWRTYIALTDLESVFRSLKNELGIRPIFHSKEGRADGHLFITVLAYQFVQFLRKKLKTSNINGSWATLKEILCVQQRTTVSFKQRDGHTLNVRKSTIPETDLKAIYSSLGIDHRPGGTKKMVV